MRQSNLLWHFLSMITFVVRSFGVEEYEMFEECEKNMRCFLLTFNVTQFVRKFLNSFLFILFLNVLIF